LIINRWSSVRAWLRSR